MISLEYGVAKGEKTGDELAEGNRELLTWRVLPRFQGQEDPFRFLIASFVGTEDHAGKVFKLFSTEYTSWRWQVGASVRREKPMTF